MAAPKTTGKFRTREQLEKFVLDAYSRSKNPLPVTEIAATAEVHIKTMHKIIRAAGAKRAKVQ